MLTTAPLMKCTHRRKKKIRKYRDPPDFRLCYILSQSGVACVKQSFTFRCKGGIFLQSVSGFYHSLIMQQLFRAGSSLRIKAIIDKVGARSENE